MIMRSRCTQRGRVWGKPNVAICGNGAERQNITKLWKSFNPDS